MSGLPSSRVLPLKRSKIADCLAQIKTIMVQLWIKIYNSKNIKCVCVCLFNFSCSSELNSKSNKLVSWLLGCVLPLHLTAGQRRFPRPCLSVDVHYETFFLTDENGVTKQVRRLLVGTKTQKHESKHMLQTLCSLPTDLRTERTA